MGLVWTSGIPQGSSNFVDARRKRKITEQTYGVPESVQMWIWHDLAIITVRSRMQSQQLLP